MIFLFFVIDYWSSAKGHEREGPKQFQKPSISCSSCGKLLRSSDQFCPNCNTSR
ncbi:MAG: zinc-ribbon domain-containing protein [Candidatus Bathyarchaeota archaeon]|nr:MAG: zinc-ribbon domain-containing protein [Candidatus Bathyarchaeota archaeon]